MITVSTLDVCKAFMLLKTPREKAATYSKYGFTLSHCSAST